MAQGDSEAKLRERLREDRPRESVHHLYKHHRGHLGHPTQILGYICGEERVYTLERMGVLALGELQQLLRPDAACAYMDTT